MIIDTAAVATYEKHPLVRQVARDLLTRLGGAALPIAHRAVGRMQAADDPEGTSLWLAIHAQLAAARLHMGEDSDTRH